MGRRVAFSSWAPLSWPSCNAPRTLSFRDAGNGQDQQRCRQDDDGRLSWFGADDEPQHPAAATSTLAALISMPQEEEEAGEEYWEEVEPAMSGVIRIAARSSDRLFCEPTGDSSSILPVKEKQHAKATASQTDLLCRLEASAAPLTPAAVALLPEEEGDDVESIVRHVRMAARLFCEPTGDCKSIVDVVEEEVEQKKAASCRVDYKLKGRQETEDAAGKPALPFKGGGVPMAVKSTDPYADFRKSMEEMVVAHGWMGWDWMKDMLEWYLQANGGSRCYSDTIVQAFVDMLMDHVFSISPQNGAEANSASTSSCSSSCPVSPTHSSCSSFSSI